MSTATPQNPDPRQPAPSAADPLKVVQDGVELTEEQLEVSGGSSGGDRPTESISHSLTPEKVE